MLRSRLGLEPAPSWLIGGRQIRIKKAEGVWYHDYAHPSGALLVENLITESPHSRPMHLRSEMMFGMVAVKRHYIRKLSEPTGWCPSQIFDLRPILARDQSTDLLRNLIISASGTVRNNKLW